MSHAYANLGLDAFRPPTQTQTRNPDLGRMGLLGLETPHLSYASRPKSGSFLGLLGLHFLTLVYADTLYIEKE